MKQQNKSDKNKNSKRRSLKIDGVYAGDFGHDLITSMVNIPPSPSDPNGSYTGKPMDPFAVPVQDADDLF